MTITLTFWDNLETVILYHVRTVYKSEDKLFITYGEDAILATFKYSNICQLYMKEE